MSDPERWAKSYALSDYMLFYILTAAVAMNAKETIFRELPQESVAHMERQRAFVTDLAERNGLKKVDGTKADFDLIQEIVSRKLISKKETWKLQALGVVFGDALISEDPKLRWMEVTDLWGTDPTLLYADSTYQLNALTMIAKRVEDGVEEPFVYSLALTVLRLAREEAPKADQR